MWRVAYLGLFLFFSLFFPTLFQASTVSAAVCDQSISGEVELRSILNCIGTVTVTNTGTANVNTLVGIGVQPGITQASQAPSPSGTLPTLHNMGTVNINGPGGVLSVISAGTLLNDRSVNVNGGSLQVSGGTITNNDKINMASGTILPFGGRFDGPGTINMTGGTLGQVGDATVTGTVVNSGGIVQPGRGLISSRPPNYFPGTLTLASYVQSGTGRLQIGIGGLLPGSQYDQLKVNGPISINGGSIVVSLINNFQPKVGDKFEILRGDILRISLTSPISLPALPEGQFWGRANFGSFFELSIRQVQPPVVGSPEPSSLLVLGSSLAWLVGWQWKRRAEMVRH
jgi:hypothetical protein